MIERNPYFDIWSEEGASQKEILEVNPDMQISLDYMLDHGAVVGQRTFLEKGGTELVEDTILYVSDEYKNSQ